MIAIGLKTLEKILKILDETRKDKERLKRLGETSRLKEKSEQQFNNDNNHNNKSAKQKDTLGKRCAALKIRTNQLINDHCELGRQAGEIDENTFSLVCCTILLRQI